MGRALYRKYRPTSFSEAIGQEHITQTLEHAIKTGKISHAYLFTGPRGIGKTSVARILAHEVNGIPYEDDSIHLDIIEIDAASNRRIDEIRELRDKVHIAPTSAKYKVYIIDEVHMLTREAFNALLKTLEEPPAHCIFILATTEVHKLPETITSRTQRFSFNPVSAHVAAKHLGTIAKLEKIPITESALELLAQHGQGSFRDSISLLDQLSTSGDKITEETVRAMLGLPASSAISQLMDNIKDGDSSQLLANLDTLTALGANPAAIAKELGNQLRNKLVNGDVAFWMPALLRELLNVTSSAYPKESLEIALLETAAKNISVKAPKNEIIPKIEAKPKSPDTKIEHSVPKKQIMAEEIPSEQIVSDKVSKTLNKNFDIEYWPKVINYAKNHAASLYTALRIAKPAFEGDTLTLYFQFPLHQKKLNQSKQKEIIGQIIEEVANAKVKIDCEVNKDLFKNSDKKEIIAVEKKVVKNNLDAATPIKSISNIFGKAEMLS